MENIEIFMNVFTHIIIFFMGTVFGSFFTLAVYRIPLKKDITHERSFCLNCNHRVEFLDLIPIFSYLFLKGRCRYCKEKIRIRYILLECLSGLVFLLGFIGLKILFPYNNVYMKLFLYVAFVFSYVTLALIAGIDKEYIKINMGVLIFGTIVQSLYILNLCILGTEINVYRYGIYLAILIVLIVINKVLDKKENRKYYLEFIALLTYVFYVLDYKMGLILFGVTIIQYLLLRFTLKKKELPLGFYLAVDTVIMMIIRNFMIFYI